MLNFVILDFDRFHLNEKGERKFIRTGPIYERKAIINYYLLNVWEKINLTKKNITNIAYFINFITHFTLVVSTVIRKKILVHHRTLLTSLSLELL